MSSPSSFPTGRFVFALITLLLIASSTVAQEAPSANGKGLYEQIKAFPLTEVLPRFKVSSYSETACSLRSTEHSSLRHPSQGR